MNQIQGDLHGRAGAGARFAGEVAIVVALAVCGGLSSIALSRGGPALCKMVALPGGLQWLAGIHVLPLILAAGLVRWPGAATAVAVLKGMVEWRAGSSHGLSVFAYAVVAGVLVDLVITLSRRRDSLGSSLLAGGLGTASNMLVQVSMAGRGGYCQLTTNFLAVLAIATASGVVFAGWPGWMLANATRRVRAGGRRAMVTGYP